LAIAFVASGNGQLLLWSAFAILIVGCLVVDLRLGSHREARISLRAAGVWSIVWISLALCFAGIVAFFRGREDAELFITGYLVEKALSVDNMFVFIMVFTYFAVKEADQPRVLKWGILGALIFRGALISAGWVIVSRFGWVLYFFAVLLVWAAYKMLTHDQDEEIHPEKNPVLNLARRAFPIVDRYEGHHFFTRERGRLHGTALLVVLIVIESTDVVFALDSIPAIFAITNDFFLVFTSNVFAILGLRALFFVLAGIMDMFRYLKIGVAGILFFIAAKMLAKEVVHVPTTISLVVIGGVLTLSILASVLIKERPAAARAGGGAADARERRGREAPARSQDAG
jgi:tellurite resistance protein TerC